MVVWRNTPDSFGRVSRALHWLMALAVIGMLALGARLVTMQPGLANRWLYGLHKTVGLTLLTLTLLRLLWHRISPPPAPIGPPEDWQVRAARTAHGTLYALLLAIPISGWVASSATGLDVMVFDRWVVPPIAPVSELWEKRGFAVHGVLTKALAALVLVHAAAALKRAWAGDGTLRRMIAGRATAADC
ncbi:MAG: cytochrome b/b6 domain-containing protein [Pseudorhodobacter sp.]|nr:cytochrome b/b6 domain-containing protein [Pseudorhodobacter sp.]